MKTKLTVLFTSLALAGAFTTTTLAGPSDSAAFALRFARDNAAAPTLKVNVAKDVKADVAVKYIPASSGKGWIAVNVPAAKPMLMACNHKTCCS